MAEAVVPRIRARRSSSRRAVEKIEEIHKTASQIASTSASAPVSAPPCTSICIATSATTYGACEHVEEYRERKGFKVLQKYMTRGGGRFREVVHRCDVCGRASVRLYTCLSCAAVCCWDPMSLSGSGSHAFVHSLSHPGHHLALDVERAELFCCTCKDQVYDRDLDLAVLSSRTSSSSSLLSLASASSVLIVSQESMKSPRELHLANTSHVLNGLNIRDNGPQTRSKKRKLKDQMPTPLVQCLPKIHSERAWICDGDGDDFLGLRGLNNLGNTCFMNSILQALLHAPPLRSYFLDGRHNQAACQNKESALCLGCEMDIIYSAVFSYDRVPYSPARFLYSWWQHAANLSGYKQQDAHEFFISVIDGIHASSIEAKKSAGNNADCGCIAHRSFSGLLRSDVTCVECGFSSTVYDPCIDISVDLEPIRSILSNGNGSGSYNCQMAAVNSSTLYGCLDRFTRLEKLGLDQKFYCENCKMPQESVKQMSLYKLPLVLCFHIKRFEHSHVRNMSRKINRYVQFPFNLDMSPYISSCIVRLRHGNRLGFFDSEQVSPTEYELFAVVSHSGKLDSGHYLTYLRLGPYWYQCNDSWVSRVSVDLVRATQAYMLYYVQRAVANH